VGTKVGGAEGPCQVLRERGGYLPRSVSRAKEASWGRRRYARRVQGGGGGGESHSSTYVHKERHGSP